VSPSIYDFEIRASSVELLGLVARSLSRLDDEVPTEPVTYRVVLRDRHDDGLPLSRGSAQYRCRLASPSRRGIRLSPPAN